MEEALVVFNGFLKRFYAANAAHIAEMEELMVFDLEPNTPEEERDDFFYFGLSELYIDFLNILLVATGIRNGTQTERIADFLPDTMLESFIQELTTEYPHIAASQIRGEGQALIVWNPARITDAQLAYSWAAEGNVTQGGNATYYVNTALLLGTPVGYPTYTDDDDVSAKWGIDITFAFQDGEIDQTGSLCGGIYRTDLPDDLRAVRYIAEEIQPLLNATFYHPSIDVELAEITQNPPPARRRRRVGGGKKTQRRRRNRLRTVKQSTSRRRQTAKKTRRYRKL